MKVVYFIVAVMALSACGKNNDSSSTPDMYTNYSTNTTLSGVGSTSRSCFATVAADRPSKTVSVSLSSIDTSPHCGVVTLSATLFCNDTTSICETKEDIKGYGKVRAIIQSSGNYISVSILKPKDDTVTGASASQYVVDTEATYSK